MNTTPDRSPADSDPLWGLEFGLSEARRVAGAMRAVRCLAQHEKFSEDANAEVKYMRREDFAGLMDVLSADLTAQLDALEGHLYVLQGYGNAATTAVVKAQSCGGRKRGGTGS